MKAGLWQVVEILVITGQKAWPRIKQLSALTKALILMGLVVIGAAVATVAYCRAAESDLTTDEGARLVSALALTIREGHTTQIDAFFWNFEICESCQRLVRDIVTSSSRPFLVTHGSKEQEGVVVVPYRLEFEDHRLGGVEGALVLEKRRVLLLPCHRVKVVAAQ